MRRKDYWAESKGTGDPFQLSKQFAKGLSDASKQASDVGDLPEVAKYLWINVTTEQYKGAYGEGASSGLSADEWMNVIDEAASLGAEWMVIGAGDSLVECPMVWTLCAWAQETHQIRVAIHLRSASAVDDHAKNMMALDTSLTCLVADRSILDQYQILAEKGIALCEATIAPHRSHSTCTIPESMLCVGIDGELYTCGLVLGEAQYRLGNVFARSAICIS